MLIIAAGLVLSQVYFVDDVLADRQGGKPGKPDRVQAAQPESARGKQGKSDFDFDDVARQVQRRHGGRVLRVDPDKSNQSLGKLRVKLLTNDGRVRVFFVNPTELE